MFTTIQKFHRVFFLEMLSGRLTGRLFTTILMLMILLGGTQVKAQCSSTVPAYTVNLTGNPDSVWTSPFVSRNGTCCGSSSSSRCIVFTVTLDPDAWGIQFDVSGGAGGTNYYINCVTAGTAGSPQCISISGTFTITFCKPGSNLQKYTITSIPKPKVNNTVVHINPKCATTLSVAGLKTSTITWTAINGSYNSFLSCTSGCSTTTVTANTGFPAYVDYQVCGTPTLACSGSSFCDTVRVYLDTALSVNISPDTPYICYGSTNVTLKATGKGGRKPYSYKWNTGATTQSITASTVGTYYVKLTDSTGCGSATDTVKVVKLTAAVAASAGADTTICASLNRVSLNGKITGVTTGKWSGGTGKFIPSDSSLTATYVPSASEISAGTVTLKLTPTHYGNCTATSSSKKITIKAAPNPTINGAANVCENTAYTYSVTNVSGDTYSWQVMGGTISSGQGTNSISITWGSSTVGYIYLTETNGAGCSTIAGFSPLSRLDFNTNPLTLASVGPNAASADADEYSDGFGTTVNKNCGGSKGADLQIPSAVMNRGKLALSFRFQRDESEANFFEWGGMKFNMSGGNLYVNYRISNGSGGYTDVGPINTGYSVPNDNTFRIYTFMYDSATGQAKVYADNSQVWTNTTTAGRSLYWTGAPTYAQEAYIMDGNCSNSSLLDFGMVAIPISVFPLPTPAISGSTSVCEKSVNTYSTTAQTGIAYSWSVSNGTITSGSGTNAVNVKWGSAGTGSITLTETNSSTGCKKTVSQSVTIIAAGSIIGIYHN